jgi:hypothetical protein
MNSGLPSLLDAIFGKNDLASVSLDEMYEVINEFPSFNAGHFLLAKKLKQENNESFEKESMRTALYFNNAFWLQTLLNEEDKINNEKNQRYFSKNDIYSEQTQVANVVNSEEDSGEPVDHEKIYVTHLQVPGEEQIKEPLSQEFPEEVIEFSNTEKSAGAVSSFDELISKYHIESITSVYESVPRSPNEDIPLPPPVVPEATAIELTEVSADRSEETNSEFVFEQGETIQQPILDSNPEEYETREEVFNEYGIFEEVLVKKSDLDLEAFDRPIERTHDSIEKDLVETELPIDENITEIKPPDELYEKSIDRDYDAFDRPTDDVEAEQHIMESETGVENFIVSGSADADDTDKPEDLPVNEQSNLEYQTPSNMYNTDEGQKPTTSFDPKKAESIVFAPYHMVDYFASQGIKLVLEENPVDNFGKQLKSFTDWLKVMKKIPTMPSSEKTDEKESDRIRHFAAHSIEERDVLTESMAEVLAKQGMFENAIALYQKLSLIYPPKSAYFASRIEQLKASLP